MRDEFARAKDRETSVSNPRANFGNSKGRNVSWQKKTRVDSLSSSNLRKSNCVNNVKWVDWQSMIERSFFTVCFVLFADIKLFQIFSTFFTVTHLSNDVLIAQLLWEILFSFEIVFFLVTIVQMSLFKELKRNSDNSLWHWSFLSAWE